MYCSSKSDFYWVYPNCVVTLLLPENWCGQELFWGHEEQSLDCIDEDACDLPSYQSPKLRSEHTCDTKLFHSSMGSPWVTLYSHKQGTLLGEKRPKKDADMAFCYTTTRSVLCSQISPALVPNWCIIAPLSLPTKSHLLVDTKKSSNSNFFFYFETPFIIKLFVQYHKKIDKEIRAKLSSKKT